MLRARTPIDPSNSLTMRNGNDCNTLVDGVPDEESPLLGRKAPSGSVLARWRKSMNAEINRSWADLVLLLCYVVTGLLDSASTQVWGSFVSMQTGQ